VSAQPYAVTKIPGLLTPPPSAAQLAILVIDGSGSMLEEATPGSGESKADAVVKATRGTIEQFKKSRIKDSFWLSTISFNTTTAGMASVGGDYVKVADLDPGQVHYIPGFIRKESKTDIAIALAKAMEVGRSFEQDPSIPIDPRSRKIVVVLLTDGLNNVGTRENVIAVSRKVSNMWALCTVAFGDEADEDLLQQIAIDDRYFFQTADAEKLRAIFIHSSTLVKR
jgi:uncharacterized protein YegL